MNYAAQLRFLEKVINEKPEFGRALKRYKKVWTNGDFRDWWLVVGGQPISDHVILTLNLEHL